jgi:F-type H+-transporting ATPase subunit beta
VYAKLEDTIRWFKDIIEGKVDHIWEDFFLYKATIDDVIAAYEKAEK